MAYIHIKTDTKPLERYLSEVTKKVPETIRAGLLEESEIIRSEIAMRAPRGKTGRLAQSWKVIPEAGGEVVHVGSDLLHAVHVSMGTRPSPGRYVPAIDRRLVDPGHPSFGMHPGIQANPYVQQGLDAGYPRFIANIRRRFGLLFIKVTG